MNSTLPALAFLMWAAAQLAAVIAVRQVHDQDTTSAAKSDDSRAIELHRAAALR